MVSTLEAGLLTKVAITPDQRLVLHGISWHAYELIGTALLNRSNIRLTYDRGTLEIMTLSPEHERLKYSLGRLIDIISDELNFAMVAFGSTTYSRQEDDRGLEPDQCYYFTNLERVRDIRRLDLTRDPVPDFAIEIDVTNSSIRRLDLYARLGIPEVWRWDSGEIRVHLLNADRQYTEHTASSLFIPSFEVNELAQFLEIGRRENHTAMARAFRAWFTQLIQDRGLIA